MPYILKHLLVVIIFSLLFSSCEHTTAVTMENQIIFYNTNQDQFTFLVFNKNAVDIFSRKYKPLLFSNKKLHEAFKDSLLCQDFDDNKKRESYIKSFSRNTAQLNVSDFNLAKNVLNATLNNEGQEYFSGSLSYLFFNECLPQKFKCKWSQSTLGHFEFNSTFFALLRDKSKELDGLIYGEIGLWNKDMEAIFGEYTFNEITPDIARKIKQTILDNKEFDDQRFIADRTNFIEFLDQTISREWRMVLIDWN